MRKRKVETMTAKELGKLLISLDKRGIKRVFLASDEEGNAFGTVDKQLSFGEQFGDIVVYPMDALQAEELWEF